MGKKILVRPRDAEPTERSFVIGLVEDPEINGIDPPPKAPKQHRSVDPFFPKLRNWEAFFLGGADSRKFTNPHDEIFWDGDFFSSLGTTCWCCQRGVVGPFFPGTLKITAGALHTVRWSDHRFGNCAWEAEFCKWWDLMVQKSQGQPPALDGTKKTLIKKKVWSSPKYQLVKQQPSTLWWHGL